MRIKEEIKRAGAFWLPSSPQRQIPGTLSIADGGHVKLELTQPIDTNMQALFGQTDSLNQILGHVEKDGPVLIDRCYRIQKKRNIAHGGLIASDVILADRVLTSFPHSEDTDLRFNTVTFSIEGIDEWVGISGIKVDPQYEERALTIVTSINNGTRFERWGRRPRPYDLSFVEGNCLFNCRFYYS